MTAPPHGWFLRQTGPGSLNNCQRCPPPPRIRPWCTSTRRWPGNPVPTSRPNLDLLVWAIMKFKVLGPVTAADGDGPVRLGSTKQRTVLAMLIAGGGRQVSIDSIIDAVWGDAPIANAKRNVQTYIATLRSIVGGAIVREGNGWRLVAEREDVDALAFEDRYESARTIVESNPERASVTLREALALWSGHPYADIESHGSLDAEIARLTELRVAALAARLGADLALGRDADLIGEIEVLLAQHPYSERFRGLHMLALYRAGRQQESLQSYRDLRSTLLDELGVEPIPELKALELQILEQDPALGLSPVHRAATRAIVVVDPGDPIEIGHLPATERAAVLDGLSLAVGDATGSEKGVSQFAAGATCYLAVESSGAAARIAERLTQQAGRPPRLAVDWGEVMIDDDQVTGAPVSRAAVLASVGHHGQVLASADARQAIDAEHGGERFRFETCGSYRLFGVDDELLIHQLLIEGQTRFPELETSRLPPPVPGSFDRSVPGYELRDRFGPGSIGILYRAFQPGVGREVLVEVIDRASSADNGFIKAFEADAHRLALLDHQNIAKVLDYWRRPDGAFLVYPFPRGGNLVDRSDLDPDRVVDQVASALAYAHSLGIIHGSLRPDRVVLDEVGNASLIGFPVAGMSTWRSIGFPAYVAPETLTGGAPTVATDVFALAVLAHELRNGPPPPDPPHDADIPALARALATNPEDRQSSVAEFVDQLNQRPAPQAGRSPTESRNPYKGLAPFHELDAADFFGRSTAVDELVDSLSNSPFLAIVGPSGIGKSSIARAGLIPAIRAGRVPGSEDWLVTHMLPGADPFLELRRAVERVATEQPLSVSEALAARQPDALSHVAEVLVDQSPLLVLVDQFEELFTLTAEGERAQFLDLITTAVASGDARFVVTLRADFVDQPLYHSDFAELFRQSLVALRAPTATELTDIITRPAHGVGVSIDPDLIQRMVTEVHDQPGALPLLQHALTELFDARSTNRIDESSYQAVGGIEGSLARRAEAIYQHLDGGEQDAIQQAFLRMVTVSDDGPPTRRRLRVADIDHLDVGQSVERFAAARMVTYDNDPKARTPTIEVAHEALLTHWPRLASWIDGAREELVLSRRLGEATQEWLANDRDPGHLLTGGRLAQHQAWTAGTTLALTSHEQELVDASVAGDATARAQRRRRRHTVLAAFAGAAAVGLVLAVVAFRQASLASRAEAQATAEALAANGVAATETDPTLALLLGLEAYRQSPSPVAVGAIHRGLQADRQLMVIPPPQGSSGVAASVDPTGSRVAIVGYGTSIVQLWEIGAEAPTWETVLHDGGEAVLPSLSHFWFSDDGTRLYVPLTFSSVGLDAQDGVGLHTVDATNGQVVDFWPFPCLARAVPAGGRYAADGAPFVLDWAVVGSDRCSGLDGVTAMADVEQQTILYQTAFGGFTPPSSSVDGRLLAATGFVPTEGGERAVTRIFNTTTDEIVREFPGAPASISSDGAVVLVGRDPIYLYDVESGNRLAAYQGDYNRVGFFPDESRVAGVGPSGLIGIFETESGTEELSLRGHTSQVRTTSIDLDAEVLVSSAFDGARVWDIASATRGDLPSIVLDSPDDDHFYPDSISASDGLVMVHRGEVATTRQAPRPVPHRVDVVDIDTEDLMWTMSVLSGRLGPDGLGAVQPVLEDGIVSPSGVEGASRIGPPVLVDAATGQAVVEMEGCEHFWVPGAPPEPAADCGQDMTVGYPYFEFSSDGRRLLGSNQGGAMTVWDVESGDIVFQRAAVQGGPNNLFNQGVRWAASLSPDSQTIVIPPSGAELQGGPDAPAARVRLVDIASGTETGGFEVDHWTNFTAFNPYSGRLLVGGDQVLVFDPDSGRTTTLARPQGSRIDALALSPDGRLAASVSLDGSLAVWDLDRGALVAEIPVLGDLGEGLRGVVFADNETILVVPETGHRILRFTLDATDLVRVASQHLTRSFRPEECATYAIEPCPSLEELASPTP